MKDEEGFNAQTDTYENLVKAGVIDPAKVVRSALQNASSIASLLLTTEALICEIPEEKKEPRPGGRRRHGRDVLKPGPAVPYAAALSSRGLSAQWCRSPFCCAPLPIIAAVVRRPGCRKRWVLIS